MFAGMLNSTEGDRVLETTLLTEGGSISHFLLLFLTPVLAGRA